MKNTIRCTASLAAVLCCTAPILSALPGDWQEPSAGYTVIYDAASGDTPFFATPAWQAEPFRGDYYGPEDSFVTTDALTGEPVLYMSPTETSEWDSYALYDNGGSGTVDDRMTIDFRFRLLDPDFSSDGGETPERQFNVAVWRPDVLGDASRRFMVHFSTEAINFHEGGTAEYEIGTDWHDARLTIDPSVPIAYLYLDGNPSPVLAHEGVAQTQAERNWIYFGHQGGAMGGEVNLAYFKFTNDEVAIEPTFDGEPTAMLTEALELSFETDAGFLYQIQGLGESAEWEDVGGPMNGSGDPQVNLLSLAEISNYRVLGGAAEWEDPANGFTVSYSASEGWTPDLSEPAWDTAIFGHDYTEDQAKLIVDDLTGETVLYLEDPDSANPQPNYALNHSEGFGTSSDLVTLEMRIRLLDPEHTGEHFNFGVWRPSPEEGKVQRYTFFVYLNAVRMLSGGTGDFDFGTEWNTIRVTIDSANQVGNLYVNGSSTPVLANQAARIENATALSGLGDRNAVYFGHQGAGSYGAMHLDYIRFTNDEAIAEGLPLEPVETVHSDALELIFTGWPGSNYQLMKSADLAIWEVIDEPFFLGTVDAQRTLFGIDGATEREFFQYVEATEVQGAE